MGAAAEKTSKKLPEAEGVGVKIRNLDLRQKKPVWI